MAWNNYKLTKTTLPALGRTREPAQEDTTTMTVGALTRAIRSTLENAFTEVVVEGEISNYLHHRSGHRYFTLKDADAQIGGVMWKSRALNFTPKDGMKVICRGRISVYPPQGKYQLDVFQMRPSGIGDLQQAYEELYARLEAEGLFAESRKRPIPRFPQTIGIVTSGDGAALQDILSVLQRRYPVVRVIVRPTAVQGMGAELDIARAIQEFNLLARSSTPQPPPRTEVGEHGFGLAPDVAPDVLIVGRGGGSLEDLWSFNEEAVARAIYASKIPVISAVGHEVDFTIADFVADLRAPTPTAAAELATPDAGELISVLDSVRSGMTRQMRQEIRQLQRDIVSSSDPRSLASAITNAIDTRRERMNAEILSATRSVVHNLERKRLLLERDSAKLSAMNPDRVLERGFTALETPEGEVIPRLNQLLERGEKAGILVFADGRITVRFD